MNNEESSVVNN